MHWRGLAIATDRDLAYGRSIDRLDRRGTWTAAARNERPASFPVSRV